MEPQDEVAAAVGLDLSEPDVARMARWSCNCTPGCGAEDAHGIWWCDHCHRPMLATTVGELARELVAQRQTPEAHVCYQGGLRRLWQALQSIACKNGACAVGPNDAAPTS